MCGQEIPELNFPLKVGKRGALCESRSSSSQSVGYTFHLKYSRRTVVTESGFISRSRDATRSVHVIFDTFSNAMQVVR